MWFRAQEYGRLMKGAAKRHQVYVFNVQLFSFHLFEIHQAADVRGMEQYEGRKYRKKQGRGRESERERGMCVSTHEA